MKELEQHKISINKESYLTSLAKDFTSLGLLGLLCWFNENFIGGSYFVNFLIFCVIISYIIKSSEKHWSFYSVKIEKINQIKELLENEKNI